MKRRSAAITLVLAGALSGCGEPTPQRDVYASLEDCQRDWSAPGECQPATSSNTRSGGGGGSWGGRYFGPDYYGSSDTSGKPRPSRNAIAAVHSPRGSVARGGFGSTSHSFSSSS